MERLGRQEGDARSCLTLIPRLALVLRTWRTLVRSGPELPDQGSGYVLAETMDEAPKLAEQPEVIAIPTEKTWPGRPGCRVDWSCKPPGAWKRGQL